MGKTILVKDLYDNVCIILWKSLSQILIAQKYMFCSCFFNKILNNSGTGIETYGKPLVVIYQELQKERLCVAPNSRGNFH